MGKLADRRLGPKADPRGGSGTEAEEDFEISEAIADSVFQRFEMEALNAVDYGDDYVLLESEVRGKAWHVHIYEEDLAEADSK